jgi:hypothetical protein
MVGPPTPNDGEIGIYMNGTNAAQVQTVTITNNYFNGGIYHIEGTDVATIIIDRNIMNDASYNSIYLNNSSWGSYMPQIAITDNRFSHWGGSYYAGNSCIKITPYNSSLTCDGLSIIGNTFDGASVSASVFNLTLSNGFTNGLIENNHIANVTATPFATLPVSGMVARNNTGFNPYGIYTNPFATSTIIPFGIGATPTSATVYTISDVDCFITSVNTGLGTSNIAIKDTAGYPIITGVTSLTAQFVPIGYSVTWTWAVTAPTVTVFGN